jgi:two-component system, cell cycle response regulator
MKKEMLLLIKQAITDQSKLKSLENIYDLYDQLQFSENLNEMADDLYRWLKFKYKVDNLTFSLFDMDKNLSTTILQKGTDFYLDDQFSFYFIVNTHTEMNAVIAFNAENEEHYKEIQEDYTFIEAAFFQISPILQNGIMKKHHVEASSIDSVTNVHNRKYLIEHINKVISLSKKEDTCIAFLMIGIDRFKAVIEEFDYDIGDQVLIELAKVIHSEIRDFDIVARLTGDEFLVALLDISSKEVSYQIAEKIIDKFAKIEVLVNKETQQTLKKTVCIGISFFQEDSSDIQQVLKNSDMFLNEAKNKGRSSYAVYKKEKESSIDLF